MALKKISQNRDSFFQKKKIDQKEVELVLWSKMRGPNLVREQVLQMIGYINQKINFQEHVDALSQYQVDLTSSYKRPLDLVMVTCLYHRPHLWKMVLKTMGKMPLKKIVAMWSEDEDCEEIQKFIEETPAEIIKKIHFVKHDNFPLNQKWQKGVMEASVFAPQAILILESDDLVTYHYLQESMLKINEGFELIGSRNWLSAFIQDQENWIEGVPDYLKLCQYNETRLDGEFIGSGRIISSYLLQKMKWQLYTSKNPLNNSLDKHTFLRMKPFHPKIFEIPFHPTYKTAIITFRERSSEKLSMSYGRYYHAQIPGNTWVGAFLQRSKNVDYLISQDVYQASLKIVYENFGEELLQLRQDI